MPLLHWKSPTNSLYLKYWICMFSRLLVHAEISCHHHCRCSSYLIAYQLHPKAPSNEKYTQKKATFNDYNKHFGTGKQEN